MRRHLAGFLILHVIAAAALYGAWRADLLVPFFTADKIGLTAMIAGVAALGVAGVAVRRWTLVAYLKDNLPTLGLLGTVVGFSMAVAGLSGDDFELKFLGLDTALNTTIAGLVGSLWLSLNERLLK